MVIRRILLKQYSKNIVNPQKKKEQYYIYLYEPEYNICQIAGSSLGRVSSGEKPFKTNKWLAINII